MMLTVSSASTLFGRDFLLPVAPKKSSNQMINVLFPHYYCLESKYNVFPLDEETAASSLRKHSYSNI